MQAMQSHNPAQTRSAADLGQQRLGRRCLTPARVQGVSPGMLGGAACLVAAGTVPGSLHRLQLGVAQRGQHQHRSEVRLLQYET